MTKSAQLILIASILGLAACSQQSSQDSEAPTPSTESIKTTEPIDDEAHGSLIDAPTSKDLSEDSQRLLELFKIDKHPAYDIMDLQRNVKVLEAEGERLNTALDTNETKIARLEARLEKEASEISELWGRYRVVAGETMPQLANSIAHFDYTGRVEAIKTVTEQRTIPTRAEFSLLSSTMLTEMAAQSEIKAFTSTVTLPSGETEEAELIRVGVFTVTTVKFQKFARVQETLDGSTELKVIENQPPRRFAKAIKNYQAARPGQLVSVPLDPSKGLLLGALDDSRRGIFE